MLLDPKPNSYPCGCFVEGIEMVSEDRQSRSVRVLVEPSDYVLRNAGDMAMLRTAVSRLIQKWPEALIQVLSDEPDALQAFCPEATPLRSAGRRYWLQMVRWYRNDSPALCNTMWLNWSRFCGAVNWDGRIGQLWQVSASSQTSLRMLT